MRGGFDPLRERNFDQCMWSVPIKYKCHLERQQWLRDCTFWPYVNSHLRPGWIIFNLCLRTSEREVSSRLVGSGPYWIITPRIILYYFSYRWLNRNITFTKRHATTTYFAGKKNWTKCYNVIQSSQNVGEASMNFPLTVFIQVPSVGRNCTNELIHYGSEGPLFSCPELMF